MGGSYSDLNVYFNRKGRSFGNLDYEVITTQKNFEGYSNFVILTHQIKFRERANPLYYNVILYDGYSDKHKGNYFFGYYYPSNEKEVIKEVHTYYSVLAPYFPLVISFKTEITEYKCLPRVLKDAGWDYASKISRNTFSKSIKDQLDEEFEKLLLKRKIQFRIGSEQVDITGYRQELDYGNNFRFIFIPKGDKSILGSDYLFSLDFIKNVPKLASGPVSEREICKVPRVGTPSTIQSKTNHENKIDEYFLRPSNDKLYDGIMVYLVRDKAELPDTLCGEAEYNKGMALLLEFIYSRNSKIQIKKKDKDGNWWAEETVGYGDDKTLLEKLESIKTSTQNNEVAVVILDKTEKYKGVENVGPEKQNDYTKYTYTFSKPNKPITIYGGKEVKIGKLDTSKFTTKKVELYYLNVKDKKDTEPFLTVFYENGNSDKKNVWHFNNTYDFTEWKEFAFEGKLQEKLDKIATSGSCSDNLRLLRSLAYQILTTEETPKPKVKETTPPKRPPVREQEPEPEGPNFPLIIGCVVAGVVVIVSLAVVYGVYWYNTTIKLLT